MTDLRSIAAPGHTALLIVDMQNDFCASDGHTGRVLRKDVAACQAVVGPIRALTDAARAAGALIVWVKADYDPRYLSAPVLAKRKASGIEIPYVVAGTWGAAFYELVPDAGDLIVEKHRHSAFTGTALETILRDRGIRTLLLAGVQTHVCIDTTLRDGFTRGYYVVVPSDCTGSFAQDLHDATLKCVKQHFGEVTTSRELIALWTGR